MVATFIERSVEEERGEGALEFQRLSRVHRSLVGRLLEEGGLAARPTAALRYAYAIARDPSTSLALLGDPLTDAARLRAASPSSGTAIQVRSIIETVEATYTTTKRRRDDHAAREKHRELLPAFADLRAIAGLDARIASQIDFHHAKALLWTGERDAAEAALRGVLRADPAVHAARLQLGRLLMDRAVKGDDGAADEAVEHFRAIVGDPATSLSIVLSCFEMVRRLPAGRLLPLLDEHRTRLIEGLSKAAGSGLEQAFGLVAALGNMLSYEAPELLDALLGVLTHLSVPGGGVAAFAYAQVEKYRAKLMASRGDAPHEIDAVLDAAIRSYDRVGNLKDWELVQFAEALVLRGQPERALRELDRAKKRDPYWNHRRAQAQRALGDLVSALTVVDQGLEGAGTDKRATATLFCTSVGGSDGTRGRPMRSQT